MSLPLLLPVVDVPVIRVPTDRSYRRPDGSAQRAEAFGLPRRPGDQDVLVAASTLPGSA